MSKEQQTGNEIQQNAVTTILKDYDSDAANILRQAQREVNQKVAETRINDHRSYQEIEAEANRLLLKAHEEGEVHIVERHHKTPMIFFFSKGLLMLWSEGKIVCVGQIPGIDSEKRDILFRVSPYIFDINDKKVANALISLATAARNGETVGSDVWLVIESKKNEFSIKKAFYSSEHTSDKSVIDLILSDSGVVGVALPDFIHTTKVIPGSVVHTSVPNVSHVAEPFTPSVIFAEKRNAFFTIYKQQIKRVDHLNKSELKMVLSAGQTGTPIALAYHSNHQSLLIQDAGKREIGLHFPDAGTERIWRSFRNDSFITLPAGVFRSDEQFTMSCLLKRNEKLPLSSNPPEKAAPFKVWVDPGTDLLKLQYEANGISTTLESTKKFTKAANSGWFLFTLQKQQDQLTIFLDGHEYCKFRVPGFPSLQSTVLWTMNGYFICELRIWETIRTREQLKMFSRMWLPYTEFSGLTGYWHLFVVGKENTGLAFVKVSSAGQTVTMNQEPDLSGNRHHMSTLMGTGEAGDLNKTTDTSYKASSPFSTVMPLYELKMIRQGLELDDNTGKIYWIDETKDGRINMMVGSVLGHIPPMALFEIDTESRFQVISQINSPYENLIIAHGERRDAMEQQFMDISAAHLQNHAEIQANHVELANKLDNKPDDNGTIALVKIDNRQAYANVHDSWLAEMNRIQQEEEKAERLASKKRNSAIAKAKEMTDNAQKQLIAHRRKR